MEDLILLFLLLKCHVIFPYPLKMAGYIKQKNKGPFLIKTTKLGIKNTIIIHLSAKIYSLNSALRGLVKVHELTQKNNFQLP